MKKIERLLAIIMVLLDQEILSTSDLAERIHVTKRTILEISKQSSRRDFQSYPMPVVTGDFRSRTLSNYEHQLMS